MPASTAKPLSFALQPARTITGRVTYADTGKPAPHAQVIVGGFDQVQTWRGNSPDRHRGRCRGAVPRESGIGHRTASCSRILPTGNRTWASTKRIDWPKGAVTHSVDLALPRGVMMRGKVTEQGSGRPISGAIVTYHPHRTANDEVVPTGSSPVETAADGSFALAVLPRPGYLVVQGPSEDYVLHELDEGLLINGQPGGQRVYAHAFVACDPKPGGESHAT